MLLAIKYLEGVFIASVSRGGTANGVLCKGDKVEGHKKQGFLGGGPPPVEFLFLEAAQLRH